MDMSKVLDNIDVLEFLTNIKHFQLVAFIKYTLSQLYNHFDRNEFLEHFGDCKLLFCDDLYLCIYFVGKKEELVLEQLSYVGNGWL